MLTENSPIENKFHCNICNKLYSNQSSILEHNLNHHVKASLNTDKKKRFFCKKCKTDFNSNSTRWRHEQKCQVIDTVSSIKKQVVEINNIKNELQQLKNKLNKNDQKIGEKSQNKENEICQNYFIIVNKKIYQRQEDNLIDISEISNIEGKQFNLWLKNSSSITFINNLSSKLNTLHEELIEKENANTIYIHENIAGEFIKWLSPTHAINFNKWLDEYKNKNIQEKTKPTQTYPDNVVYIITNKSNKENNIYIIGKAQNLKSRLSGYNKSNEHEVIYYKQCDSQKMTHVVESMVLLMLYKYREYLNRDRFILPKDKSIEFFTNAIDKAVAFFSKENQE